MASSRIKSRRRPSSVIVIMAALFLSLSQLSTFTCFAASINVPPNPAETASEEEGEEQKEESTTKETTPDEHSKTTSGGANNAKESTSSTTTCRWGEHCPDDHQTTSQTQNDSTTSHLIDTDPQPHIPFVPPNTKASTSTSTNSANMSPPEGFVITSRVYTDPDDKLAHFDSSGSIVLEYLDCGALGSTTSPLQLKHAYFRHCMPRAAPHLLWSGTEFGTHPQLLIPLKPLQLLLNSGEEQLFVPGNVILLEDVLQAGHKISSPHAHEDMSALLLTLPQHYHHVGKDRTSLTTTNSKNNNSNNKANSKRACGSFAYSRNNGVLQQQIRQAIFATIGLGGSGILAFFLGKVAPLWLSVGVGGMCFILGGTYATVTCGEYLWQEGELALERRRLGETGHVEQQVDDVLLQEPQELLLKESELLLKEEQASR